MSFDLGGSADADIGAFIKGVGAAEGLKTLAGLPVLGVLHLKALGAGRRLDLGGWRCP